MPNTPSNNGNLTVKQQREQKRAAKVAVLKKQQAREKRNRRFAIIGGIVAVVAVLALVIGFVVVSAKPKVDPADITVEGVETWDDLTATHVTTAVDYEALYGMTPPAGGDHAAAWLNCGVYTEEQQPENAVHALEHGALWVTYDPAVVNEADAGKLADALPSNYIVLSPYPDLPSPVVASGWGVQVQLDGIDDERLSDFVDKYWRSADVPEPGASCTGAIDGPGKIA
jgi:flagellar basal body-associated protein FliL